MNDHAHANEGPKSSALLFWAFIMGFLAFVTAVGKFFEDLPKIFLNEHQLWFTEFLADLVVALLVSGLILLLLRQSRIDWRGSLLRVRLQSTSQLAVLCLLGIATIVLAGFLWKPVGALYRIRYQRASLDWPAVRVLDLMRLRDYEGAQKELKKVSRKDNAAKTAEGANDFRSIAESLDRRYEPPLDENKTMPDVLLILSLAERDINGRLKDAKELTRRFEVHKKEARSPTFQEVLMVGRAARLAPRVSYVKTAMAEARAIVEEALAQYLGGIERIKRGDALGAAEELNQSRTTCRGFLHQDLLIRYAGNRDLKAYSLEERGLIQYYMKTPGDVLKVNSLEYPPIKLFLARDGQKR